MIKMFSVQFLGDVANLMQFCSKRSCKNYVDDPTRPHNPAIASEQFLMICTRLVETSSFTKLLVEMHITDFGAAVLYISCHPRRTFLHILSLWPFFGYIQNRFSSHDRP